MSAGLHALFVFGTLKRGFPLHERGLAGIDREARALTVHPYPLVVAGPWFAPMMLNQPGAGHRVFGELYHVNYDRLATIDGIESIGKPGNLRETVEIERLDGGGRLAAFVYMKAAELARPVHTGYLEEYLDDRFVPPEARPRRQ